MKLSMPNKHLIFESQRENSHNIYLQKQRSFEFPSPHKDSNYMLLYQNFQKHDIRINVSG